MQMSHHSAFFCGMMNYTEEGANFMTSSKGLEGVVATQSAISSIIDDTLTYVGYNIDDLADNASFEEVIYLLWHQRLPKADELAELKQQLAESMAVPTAVLDHFK